MISGKSRAAGFACGPQRGETQMSHELSRESGRVEAVYAGGKPAWHGLGTVVEDAPTSADAIRLAGLDWTVGQEELFLRGEIADANGRARLLGPEVPNAVANVRSDTRRVLGIVTRRYTPVQNVEAFRFVDALVDEAEVRYESAGALFGGQTVWLLARLPEVEAVAGVDKQMSYVLFANSHDGGSAVQVLPTNVRVVCWNTLNFALRNGKEAGTRRYSIRHVGDVMKRIDEAREAIGLVRVHFHDYMRLAETLVKRELSNAEFGTYLDALFPKADNGTLTPQRAKVRRMVTMNYTRDERQQLPGIERTAWAAVNAVTQYHDHDRRFANTRVSTAAESRLYGSWLGTASKDKARAMRVAAELFAPSAIAQ